MSRKEKLNVAFVGLSSHALEHLLPALKESSDFRIGAVASRDLAKARNVQAQFGATACLGDWKTALAIGGIDAVIATGPPQFHEEVVVEALQRQLPIFVEKPCAASLTSMRDLVRATLSGKGAPTFVGYNFRHAKSFQDLLAMSARAHGLGQLTIRFETNKPRTPLWHYRSTFESFLYAIAVHPIEMALAAIGPLSSMDGRYEQRGTETFSLAIVLTGLGGGVAHLFMSNCAPRFHAGYRAVTLDGTMLSGSPTEYIQGAGELTAQSRRVAYGYDAELFSFAKAIRLEQPSTAPLPDSLPVYEVIQWMVDSLPYGG